VIDLLSRLVDKSLVVATHVGKAARFRLLDTIRQYAAEKLAGTSEITELRQRHGEFFLQWAEQLAPSLLTAQRGETMDLIDVESDNLRAAIQFFADTDHTDAEMRLCQALFFHWFFRGQWTEGRRRLDEALARSRDSGMTPLRAKTMSDTGMFASMMGDHKAARILLEESCEIHRQQGNEWPLANALVFLAYELALTDLMRARKLVEEGVAICREGDSKFFLAMALNHKGAIAFVQKDHPTARTTYEEAAALSRELNDNWALASSLRGLGAVALRLKDYELAAINLKESLASLRKTKEKWITSRTLDTLAEMYSSQKEHERAARLFGAAATTRETVGASLFAFYREEYENYFDEARNALGPERFDSLWAEGRAMTLEQAAAFVLNE
jgi:non-specific serine/threonine protein kinase